MNKNNTDGSVVPWKPYITLTAESILTFYLATFCAAMYLTHHQGASLILDLIVVVLYVFVILVCGKRILEKVSVGALMLIIPIAPVIAIVTVISLIPILEVLK